MTDFNEYQSATNETAKYPEVNTGSLIAVNYAAIGASNEAGELLGKIKKAWRDDDMIITDSKRQEILDEAGDVLWYLTRLAEELGTTLEAVADANLAKLRSRNERGVIGGSGDYR